MNAKLYKATGEVEDVQPENGTDFSLQELRKFVGGSIDIQALPKSNLIMVLNDEGKLDGLEKNEKATEIWKMNYPIAEYLHNNDELVVGDVLICSSELVD